MAKKHENDAPEAQVEGATNDPKEAEGQAPGGEARTMAQPTVDTSEMPESQVTNTPNPALPPGTDVGTLEQPKNTGSGDTPAPGTPGSAPGPEDARPLRGQGPYPPGGDLPTQDELPPTKTENG